MKPLLRYAVTAASVMTAVVVGVLQAAPAGADNKRLNNSVAANVYTIQHQAGCTGDLHINPNCGWPPNGTPTTCSTIATSMATWDPTGP